MSLYKDRMKFSCVNCHQLLPNTNDSKPITHYWKSKRGCSGILWCSDNGTKDIAKNPTAICLSKAGICPKNHYESTSFKTSNDFGFLKFSMCKL